MKFVCVLLGAIAFASLSDAHMWLRTPISRGGENNIGGNNAPCNGLAPGSGKTRTVFEEGTEATFAFRVNQHGPAPFTFAFAEVDNTNFVPIKANISYTVTAGSDDFNGVFVKVTIPSVLCDKCSIQLSGMGQLSGTGKWYNCADIKIVAKGSLGNPVVNSITPATGPTSGGTEITISGSNFGKSQQASLKCRFELAEVAATWLNETRIKCRSPPSNVPKEAIVKVTTDGKLYSVTGSVFEYTGDEIKPVISSIEPPTGKAGTKLTITGQNFFSSAMQCKFGQDYFVDAAVVSNTEASCYVPTTLNLGSIPVEVNVDGSPYSTSGKSFTITTADSNSATGLLPHISLLLVAIFFVVFA